MKFKLPFIIRLSVITLLIGCNLKKKDNVPFHQVDIALKNDSIKPLIVTETVLNDTDDPAIWINYANVSKSLIIGTDKDSLGALYVYDLNGKIIREKVVSGLRRPNNVDIEYGFKFNGNFVDIAIVTERLTNKLRVFSLPDLKPIDGGGIQAFENEKYRSPMGIAIYRRRSDSTYFAIVGRKEGPTTDGYLWQYELKENQGIIVAKLVRKFGAWSGKKEIESIAVDDNLGFVYYSDETFGIRKYYADPAKGNQELALFGRTEFKEDHEGISIYESNDSTGFILVSDQQASKFHVFPREGIKGNHHFHPLIKAIQLSVKESDGSDITNQTFSGKFPGGLFVAMSDDKTFHFYSCRDILGIR